MPGAVVKPDQRRKHSGADEVARGERAEEGTQVRCILIGAAILRVALVVEHEEGV